MKRFIYNQLKNWKLSSNRKPLIMYGARQVGKTYIIKEFGNNEFENMVYINCYKNKSIAQLFQGDANAERLAIGLAAYAHQDIIPGKTLVFLDEIQEIPPVLSSLKYFCEDKPELHIIVAGSLLGVMNMKGESFPVGKVDIMHLYPMTYEETAFGFIEKRRSGTYQQPRPKIHRIPPTILLCGRYARSRIGIHSKTHPNASKTNSAKHLKCIRGRHQQTHRRTDTKSKDGMAIHPCTTGS